MHSAYQTQSPAAMEARLILDQLNRLIRDDFDRAKEMLHDLYNKAAEQPADEDIVYWYSVACGNIAGWMLDNYLDGFEQYIARQEAAIFEFERSDRLTSLIASSYRHCAWRITTRNPDIGLAYLKKLDRLCNQHRHNPKIACILAVALSDVISALAPSDRTHSFTLYERLTDLEKIHPDTREILDCRLQAIFTLIDKEPDFGEAKRLYEHAVTRAEERRGDAKLESAVTELGWRLVINQLPQAEFNYGLQIVDRQENAAQAVDALPDTVLHFTGTIAFLITRFPGLTLEPVLALKAVCRGSPASFRIMRSSKKWYSMWKLGEERRCRVKSAGTIRPALAPTALSPWPADRDEGLKWAMKRSPIAWGTNDRRHHVADTIG
jgi:hypothetical protein